MTRKERTAIDVEEPGEDTVQSATADFVVITPKDRLAFESCLATVCLMAHRSRVAYFRIDGAGIHAFGRKLPCELAPWAGRVRLDGALIV